MGKNSKMSIEENSEKFMEDLTSVVTKMLKSGKKTEEVRENLIRNKLPEPIIDEVIKSSLNHQQNQPGNGQLDGKEYNKSDFKSIDTSGFKSIDKEIAKLTLLKEMITDLTISEMDLIEACKKLVNILPVLRKDLSQEKIKEVCEYHKNILLKKGISESQIEMVIKKISQSCDLPNLHTQRYYEIEQEIYSQIGLANGSNINSLTFGNKMEGKNSYDILNNLRNLFSRISEDKFRDIDTLKKMEVITNNIIKCSKFVSAEKIGIEKEGVISSFIKEIESFGVDDKIQNEIKGILRENEVDEKKKGKVSMEDKEREKDRKLEEKTEKFEEEIKGKVTELEGKIKESSKEKQKKYPLAIRLVSNYLLNPVAGAMAVCGTAFLTFYAIIKTSSISSKFMDPTGIPELLRVIKPKVAVPIGLSLMFFSVLLNKISDKFKK